MIEKWGETALAALCVLAIIFAALYTRQDDLKRLAARDAAASRDESLTEAREQASFQWPVAGAQAEGFIGAARTDSGLWRFSPYVRFSAVPGQSVLAMAAGTVLRAEDGCLWIDHGNGIEIGYRQLQSLRAAAGQAVTAGQAVGTAGSGGIQVCALRDGKYIDPLKLTE
ncbi:MAG: M23 family metallopeptidase [Clostridia bacterium]|nr:M23 family metallopeptidase [Clostridia bacterium]